MKFRLPQRTPSNQVSSASKEPNRKKVLLFMAGSLIVLALVLGSIAAYQKHQERVAQEDNNKAVAAQKAEKAKDDEIVSLKAQVAAEHSDKMVGCTYISGLTKTRIVQQYVVLPNTMHCPNPVR